MEYNLDHGLSLKMYPLKAQPFLVRGNECLEAVLAVFRARGEPVHLSLMVGCVRRTITFPGSFSISQ